MQCKQYLKKLKDEMMMRLGHVKLLEPKTTLVWDVCFSPLIYVNSIITWIRVLYRGGLQYTSIKGHVNLFKLEDAFWHRICPITKWKWLIDTSLGSNVLMWGDEIKSKHKYGQTQKRQDKCVCTTPAIRTGISHSNRHSVS